ncbi:MAG: ribose 1,5-bisphosphate isomerase [Candidatus Dojkabacteria bacterium]
MDFTKYTNIEQIESDIKSVTIQGATNVAIATLEGIKLFTRRFTGQNMESFMNELETVAVRLSQARTNEPLAKNGVRYLTYNLRTKYAHITDLSQIDDIVRTLSDEYLKMIEASKIRIIQNSEQIMNNVNEVLTHCHSSTVESVIINRNNDLGGNLVAVCTETRPLFQGRITATNLLNGGVKNTTLIADSAVESYIIGRGHTNIDVVFIGCDEITMQGDAINKIGSWGVASAAKFANKPLYVVGSILKTDPSSAFNPPKIEMRKADEIWKDAPIGLNMVNPSFDLVDHELITGFITELGIIKPNEIETELKQSYPWLF